MDLLRAAVTLTLTKRQVPQFVCSVLLCQNVYITGSVFFFFFFFFFFFLFFFFAICPIT